MSGIYWYHAIQTWYITHYFRSINSAEFRSPMMTIKHKYDEELNKQNKCKNENMSIHCTLMPILDYKGIRFKNDHGSHFKNNSFLVELYYTQNMNTNLNQLGQSLVISLL